MKVISADGKRTRHDRNTTWATSVKADAVEGCLNLLLVNSKTAPGATSAMNRLAAERDVGINRHLLS